MLHAAVTRLPSRGRSWPGSRKSSPPRTASSSTSSRRRPPTRSGPPTCWTRCSAHYPESADLARDIVICEQEGDRITHDIIQRLNSTFVTPIDREDILAADLGARRRRRPHRRGLRLPRPVPHRGADGAGAAPGPHPPAGHARRSPRRCRACATSRTSRTTPSRSTGSRTTATASCRDAIASLFHGGIDPMVVIRWKDIFERLEEAIDATRARRQRARGHRHQEHARACRGRHRPRHRRRDGAGLRLHERVPRHGERDRDVRLDPRDVPALRGGHVRRPELRRGVHLPRGRGHRGQGHRRGRRDHDDGRLRRPHRRDHVEPGDLVASGCPRAPRTRSSAGWSARPSSPTARASSRATASSRRSSSPGSSRRSSPSPWPGSRSSSPTGSSGACARAGQPRLPPTASSSAAAMFSLAHGTNDAQKTMGIITLALIAHGDISSTNFRRPHLGRHLLGDRDRARHVRRAAGASSARWAAASSRWTRRRASRPRGRAPRWC